MAAFSQVLAEPSLARRSLGASREAIRAVTYRSVNNHEGVFSNLDAPGADLPPTPEGSQRSAATAILRRGDVGRPASTIPMERPDFPTTPRELAATWLGHATVLVEIGGRRVLTDPVFGLRASPSRLVGPARMHPVPVTIDELPPVDVVLISHDHYDHLDVGSVSRLAARQPKAMFVTALGVGAHLRSWGIDPGRIVELDWSEEAEVAGVTLACRPARHFSGRGLARNLTLWSSWAISREGRRVYFGGDTGFSRRFADIGAEFGRFDLTLLPIGAYNDMWRDIHADPDEALEIHRLVGGGDVLLPIHWGTFNLAMHPWGEPAERLLAAAQAAGVGVLTPRPGGSWDAAAGVPEPVPWWREVGDA